jgi:outer membrane protein insertion porin family
LGDQGYAFANVNAVPEVDEKNATVAFTFFIDPGKRVYVRRIRFEGNLSTQDGVLRREMRQFESAWYSASKIRRSRERLQRLGFFNSVTVETPTVPGTPDQVDIIVRVEERLTGNLIFGLGFSDAEGVLINASVSESNLFGTGKEISVTLNKSDSVKAVSIRYVNPYFGKGGVSRGFRLFVRDVDTTDLDIGDYETNSRGGGIFFGIPISETRKLNLGLDLEQTEIGITVNSAQVAQDFVAANGPENDILKMTFGWSQDSLDRFLFPSKGALQRFTGEISVPGSDLEYYKLTYQAARYWPVSRRTSFRAKGELGLGDGFGDTEELPFYKNFFAGGTSTVRGFESRSLGPRDTRAPFDPIGGDKRVLGNVQYIFPLSGEAQESMRVSLFVDAGQVYGPDDDVDLDLLRYSTGLAFNWLSPVGPLALSYAVPLNDEPFDELERFQFSLGVPFR